MSYLRSFPFDKIKIDRSFIEDLSNGAEPLAIVHAVAGLAKCLNMISTAEGVETQQQLDKLHSVGCTEMQGYLFSRARPAREIAYVASRKGTGRGLIRSPDDACGAGGMELSHRADFRLRCHNIMGRPDPKV
jgi:predicted signal transduction protein with EAL and GGDEF domain